MHNVDNDSRPNRHGNALPEEVAQYLRCTTARLANDRYHQIGPPFIKHGRNVLYRWVDVYAWEDANTVATSEAG